jgi:DDE superfamily endonuclease
VVGGALAPDQKKADEDKATIVWVDEAGFYLLPMAVRTWAPGGQTPVLRVKLTRDHLSAISGMTLDGRLFMQVRPASYDAEAVVGFLRVLLRKIPGKIVLIWDGSPIHRANVLKDFLKRGAAKRLHLEQLPGYAPDLNPDEGIWNYREAGLNWAMSVVPTSTTSIVKLFAPKSACSTKRRSSSAALANVVTWFSFLLQDQ